MFQRFVFNTSGQYRKEDLEGRPHLVVPVSMLGEEVLEGSEGPILYPMVENEKSTAAWNGMPLVVYHPQMNGKHVSARVPVIYNNRKVGLVFNTSHTDKLRAEAWFDEALTKKVDERVYNAIINNQQMEVSTGLRLDYDPTPGEINGKKYNGIATNYKPDHLAILPDTKGAYSIEMGGGMFANQRQLLVANQKSEKVLDGLANDEFADPLNRRYAILTQVDVETAAMQVHNSDDPEFMKRRIAWQAGKLGLKVPETWVTNAVPFSDTESMLRSALGAKFGEKGKSWNGWVYEVYPDSVMFMLDEGKMYRIGYTMKNNAVELADTAEEVVRTVTYVPITANSVIVTNQEDGMKKTAKELVDQLIANGQAGEGDRGTYEVLAVPLLEKLVSTFQKAPEPMPAPTPVPVVNAGFVQITVAEREVLNRYVAQEAEAKKQLVARITANANCKFTAEGLITRSLDELDAIALLMAPTAEDQMVGNGMFVPGYRAPLYTGAAGYGQRQVVNNAPLENLEIPDIFAAK